MHEYQLLQNAQQHNGGMGMGDDRGMSFIQASGISVQNFKDKLMKINPNKLAKCNISNKSVILYIYWSFYEELFF